MRKKKEPIFKISLRILFLTLIYLIKILTTSSAVSPPQKNDTIGRLLGEYDRGSAPGRPTIVKLGIFINSFDSINEQTMDYAINIYLRQEWEDHRLKFIPKPGENVTKLKTEDGIWDRIWVPDVFFRNEKKANFHFITIPNRLLWIYSNGSIYYSTKISAVLSCNMNLIKYPLDRQVCPMEFESFGNTMDYLKYEWRHNPVESEKLSMPQFELTNTTTHDCSQNYSSGAFPCLKIKFHLRRDIGYYMIQIYVPSLLVVILSWVAFWISADAIPARVTIGLLTVLTMTTQSSGARSSLPRVSYIKAIDVWLSACLLFVFASLLEFALVNVYSRKYNRRRFVAEKKDETIKALSTGCSQVAFPFKRENNLNATAETANLNRKVDITPISHQNYDQEEEGETATQPLLSYAAEINQSPGNRMSHPYDNRQPPPNDITKSSHYGTILNAPPDSTVITIPDGSYFYKELPSPERLLLPPDSSSVLGNDSPYSHRKNDNTSIAAENRIRRWKSASPSQSYNNDKYQTYEQSKSINHFDSSANRRTSQKYSTIQEGTKGILPANYYDSSIYFDSLGYNNDNNYMVKGQTGLPNYHPPNYHQMYDFRNIQKQQPYRNYNDYSYYSEHRRVGERDEEQEDNYQANKREMQRVIRPTGGEEYELDIVLRHDTDYSTSELFTHNNNNHNSERNTSLLACPNSSSFNDDSSYHLEENNNNLKDLRRNDCQVATNLSLTEALRNGPICGASSRNLNIFKKKDFASFFNKNSSFSARLSARSKKHQQEQINARNRAALVDKCSRAAFPITFIIFNAVYWIFYLFILKVTEEEQEFD